MGIFVLIRAVALLCILGQIEGKKKRSSNEITGLEYTAVDLNLTLSWNPWGGNVSPGQEILYTVIQDRHDSDGVPVPHCVNIMATTCWLAPFFETGDEFGYHEVFRVKYTSSVGSRRMKGQSKPKIFYSFHVEASAPVIFNSTVTSSDVTVWVHGPVTPYVKNNRTRTLGEPNLGGRLRLKKIHYRSNLTNLDDPLETPKQTGWVLSPNGKQRIDYSRLHPNTRYLIQIQCKLGDGNKNIGNATWMEFRTKQRAPEYRPHIHGHNVTRRSCGRRDVLIYWKENDHQRSNVEITNYTLAWHGLLPGESANITVPVNILSAVIEDMDRWREYNVTVTSFNAGGATKSETYKIQRDTADGESYKVTNMSIEELSNSEWRLTWDPPTDHQECIFGYRVATSIDGATEEQIFVEGHNASSASLRFRKVGRYIIELETVIDSVEQANVTVTIQHHVKGWKFRQWAILTSIMSLAIITLTAVFFMSMEVWCDLGRLKDISNSRSMRLASTKEQFIPTPKAPPEREFFHTTKITAPPIAGSTGTRSSSTGGFSESSSTSAVALLPTSGTPDHCLSHSDEGQETVVVESGDADDSRKTMNTICNRSPLENGGDTSYSTESNYKRPKSGYVHSAPKTKPSLTVYIPKHISSMHMTSSGPQCWSADSGISTSPYIGPLSDYVPASPAFESGSGSLGLWYGYDIRSRFPYVASSQASEPERLGSTSFEPRQMSLSGTDPNDLEGYLPMSPCSTLSREPQSPMEPYSKSCAKMYEQ